MEVESHLFFPLKRRDIEAKGGESKTISEEIEEIVSEIDFLSQNLPTGLGMGAFSYELELTEETHQKIKERARLRGSTDSWILRSLFRLILGDV